MSKKSRQRCSSHLTTTRWTEYRSERTRASKRTRYPNPHGPGKLQPRWSTRICLEPPYIRQEQARAKERSLYLETLKKESNRQETNTDEFTPIDAGIEQSTANREWARLNENDEMQAQELYVFQTSLGTSRLKEEVDRFGNCFFLSLARQWLLSQERPPSNTPYIPDADLYKTTAFSISDQVLDYMLAHRSDFEDSFAFE